MYPIFYSIISVESSSGKKFLPISLIKFDENFIVCSMEEEDFKYFSSFEDAKFFITEIQKPNYCKILGTNYQLKELDQFSEEWITLFNKWLDV